MIFPFSEPRLIGESPLSDVDSTIHDNNWKIMRVVQPETELMIEDRLDSILQGDWRYIGGLYLIAENGFFCKSWVYWDLDDLQMNEGAVSVGNRTFFSQKFSTFVLISD